MLTLESCGHRYIHPDGLVVQRPNGAGNYAFLLFHTPAKVLLDNTYIIAPKNSFILFRPNTPQDYQSTTTPYINDWFHFEGDNANTFLESMSFPLDTVINADDPMGISQRVRELSLTLLNNSKLQGTILNLDLQSFLCKLMQNSFPPEFAEKHRLHFHTLIRLRHDIYSCPKDFSSVETLADRARLSKSYLQHLYKELFNISVINDVITARLEYAKHLLLTGSFSVNEVSEMCGYENSVHFIRQFKKHIGYSPGKFAKNN